MVYTSFLSFLPIFVPTLPPIPEIDFNSVAALENVTTEPLEAIIPMRGEGLKEVNSSRRQFDFTLDFKTTATEGILFYATDANERQYIGLFLQNGHLVYSFNGGLGPAAMISEENHNDGNWHHVNISRKGSERRLLVDGNVVIEGQTPEDTSTGVPNPPYYIGGVPLNKSQHVFANLNTTADFDGCIANVRMNEYGIDNPTIDRAVRCMDVEPVSFGVQGGYMKLKDRFKVGVEIDIKMEIKPRNMSGLILSMYGKTDYLLLEMVDGAIKLTAENGRGAINTTFKPDEPNYLMDGQWHTIQAVKVKHLVTVSVDNTFADPGIGDDQAESTDTAGAMFLGGHKFIRFVRGLSTRSQFVGCIKNVKINNNPIKLIQQMAEGDVTVGSCSTG